MDVVRNQPSYLVMQPYLKSLCPLQSEFEFGEMVI